MLTVLARLTLCKTENKKSFVLLSWFSGTPYTGTQKNRSSLASSSQTLAASLSLNYLASNAWLAGAG
jgi:hypothetical protein